MAYVNKYRLAFKNPSEEQFTLYILEDGYSGDVIELKGNEVPVTYNIIDTDQNPYLPIQGSEMIINIIDEGNFSLSDLFTIGATSNIKYKVELYSVSSSTRPIWVGFIDTQSSYEEIIDEPRLISLVAMDGIGILKNKTFLDHDEVFQYGKYTLLQCIEWCIAKTTLELDLHIGVSVFEEEMDDRDVDPANEPFSQCKVHTRSFKNQNCYEVMEAICEAFGATFYQFDGAWRIERKHDRWNNRLHTETVIAYPYTTETPTSNTVTHRTTSFVPIEQSHKRFYISPYKSCKTTYDFFVPDDIPRNSKFTEGDFIALLSDSDNSAYTIDHWQLVKNLPTEINSTATPYRNDQFDPVSEKLIEQTIRIPREVAGTANANRLRSTSVEVNQGDRVELITETRTKFYYDVGSSYFAVFYVRFVGVSTTVYTLQDQGNDLSAPNENCTWEPGTGSEVQFKWPPNADSDVWHSFSCISAPFPEDGELYIYLRAWDSFVTANETWFKNFKVNFYLYMGASTNLKSEQALISQDATYTPTGEFKVKVGDSPKRLASGALWRGSDDTQLTAFWYQQGYAEVGQRLLQIINRGYFQLQHRFKTRLDGNIYGVVYPSPEDTTGNSILSSRIEMVYAPTTMSGTKYIPTNLSIDLAGDTASVYLMEFYNADEAENPTGDDETLTYLYG